MLPFVRWTVFAFSLVLLLAGILPFLVPNPQGQTSNAPAYALFHLAASAVGFGSVALSRGSWTPWFALAFGAADLYQWLASLFHWFPQNQFRWTAVDDGLHLGLGLALVVLGATAIFLRRNLR